MCLLVQIPFSFANETSQQSSDYIYFDLNAGKVSFSGSTYTGYVFATVNGSTTTQTITGTHTSTNEYYVYQSNSSNKSTTGLVNGEYIIPTYSRIMYNGQDWDEYITNNTKVDDVINNWPSSASSVGRTGTSNWVSIKSVGSTTINMVIDNLWSTYQINKNSGDSGGLSINSSNTTVNFYSVGQNRFGNIHYTATQTTKSKIVFNGTGSMTVADMANQKGYNHYNSIIGSCDSNDNAYGIVINSGVVYAGALLSDNCTAIGGGGNGLGGVVINGGTITAVASTSGAAIGGGIGESSQGGNAEISITGGEIYAYNFGYASSMSGKEMFIPAVAIGGGSSCKSRGNNSTIINISGGRIYAQCLSGAAIGGGSSSTVDGGSATINISGDAHITAVSLENTKYSLAKGSGIGGGTGGTGGNGGSVTLNVSGGTIITQDIGGGRTNNSRGTIGSAKIDISGGNIQGRFIMDSTNLSSGDVCYFKMKGGIINNEMNTNSTSSVNGMAVHIVGAGSDATQAVAQLSGGTIKNCNASYGGAIYIAQGGSFAMSGGSILNSEALQGGAVYLDGGSFVMTNGTIDTCFANDATQGFGGAVYMSSGTFSMSGGQINGCSSTISGGAVYMSSGIFTMDDGTIDNCTSVSSGGTVYLYDGSFILNDGTISNSNVDKTGGAVYLYHGSFTMTGGNLTNCSSSLTGGAVYIVNGTFNMSGGDVSSCEAKQNGGAVYIVSGKFLMSNGTISDCEVENSGGGVYLDNGEFSVSGGKMSYCSATISGGAIYINDGSFEMSLGEISYCTTTQATGSYGGAVYLNSGAVTMTAGVISECGATSGGGGVYVSGGNFELSGSGLVENCTSEVGGGVYVDNGDIIISSFGTVKGCRATLGGGMAVFSGNVMINGGSLLNNHATDMGGGIYASSDTTNLVITVASGSILGNTTYGDGGGIGVNVGDGYSARVTIGLEECAGTNESHSHPQVTDNTATANGGGVYIKGLDITLDVYCGKLNQNIAINNSGSADIDQSGGSITIFGGEIGENISVSGGSFKDSTDENIKQVTIIYHSNFGSNETSTITISEGMKISLPSNLFVRDDYNLVGWSLVQNPTQAQIIPLTETYVIPGDNDVINMYSVWKYRGSGTVLTPAIMAGKEYSSVRGETTIVVSSESELSFEFAVTGLIPNTYTERTLRFANALSSGTTILMIEYLGSAINYYYFIASNNTTSTILLTSFIKNGTTQHYQEPTINSSTNEKYIFIMDFPLSNATGSNEVTLYRYATNDDEAPIVQNVAYVLTANREFNLTVNSSVMLDTDLVVSYQPKKPIGDDSFYNSKSLALVIKAKSGNLPKDLKLSISGNDYYLNSNGHFIVPLGDVNTAKSITLKFNSATMQENLLSANLSFELMVSETLNNQNVMNGIKVAEKEVSLKTSNNPAIIIDSFEDRVFYKNELNYDLKLIYRNLNVENAEVTIFAQKKVGDSYQNDTSIIKYVDNNTGTNGIFDISSQTDGILLIKLHSLNEGTYRLVINVSSANGTISRVVYYNFIII